MQTTLYTPCLRFPPVSGIIWMKRSGPMHLTRSEGEAPLSSRSLMCIGGLAGQHSTDYCACTVHSTWVAFLC